MKKLLLAAGVIALMVGCSGESEQAAEGATKVRLAVDVPYKPFEYRAPDGSLTGFEIELGDAVCAAAQLECEWVVQAWDGIIPGLLARKYDAIFSSMSINEERKQKVNFSEPYYNTPTGFFAAKTTAFDPTDSASLAGLKIGVQRGTIQDDYATEQYGEIAEIRRYTTGDELVQDLVETGRLDLVVLDFPVGAETVLSGDKAENFQSVGEPIQLGNGVGVALRKRDGELLEKFNAALAEVKQNGTYDRIRVKYFDYDIKM